MYIPAAFREDDPERLAAFMQQYSFATLVSHQHGMLVATHLPLLLDTSRGDFGLLMGHMARANQQWQGFDGETEVLVMFQGPDAYISPAWYQETVAVPTWNYAAVHAYGIPRLVEDNARLRQILEAAVATYEAGFQQPWSLAQLPEAYVTGMMRAIVGFEIPISRLEGKFKLSQNRSAADQTGVVAALQGTAGESERAVAQLMAAELARQEVSVTDSSS